MRQKEEVVAIQRQLKEILKQKKYSYKKIADVLGVAEITIKRFFSSEELSFSKLQQICQVIGISALDLIAVVTKGGEQAFSMSLPQEKALSENEDLYNFFVCLLKTPSLKFAAQKGHKKELFPKFLRELEKLGLAEIPLGDGVAVNGKGVLTWIKGGPLQKKYMRLRHIRYVENFEARLSSENTYLASSQRSLRPESLQEMKRDLEFVVQKFRARAYREETIYSVDQLVSLAWLVGLGEYPEKALY